MLRSALSSSGLIFAVYVVILIFSSLIFKRVKGRILALGLVNYGGLIGLAAFLSMPLYSPLPLDYQKLVCGIILEILCAGIFLYTSWKIILFVRYSAQTISYIYIYLLIILKLLFFIINYVNSGGVYGIFSNDSRLDFLTISPTIAKTRYLDWIIDFVVLLSISLECVQTRTITLKSLIAVLAIIFFGFMTGSKGGTILLLTCTVLITYASNPDLFSSIPRKLFLWAAVLLTNVISLYVYILSEVLDIPFKIMVDMTFARFLLSADARIMAFDSKITEYILSHPHGSLLAELFRGPSKLLGIQVAEFPIGIYQYQAEYGTTNFVGSTNQFSAMVIIFGDNHALIDLFIVFIILYLLILLFTTTLRGKNIYTAWLSAASLFWLVNTFSQGFDAFVQIVPICLITLLFFKLFEFLLPNDVRRHQKLTLWRHDN